MKQEDLPEFDIDPKLNYKFFDLERNIRLWNVFFNYFGKEHKILDFGCGSGISIHHGRKLGFDIYGLDTNSSKIADQFTEFRDKLDVSKYTKIYDGYGKLPFDDNSFSLIVCRSSFDKFNKVAGEKKETIPLAIERLKEFDRISYAPKIVVLTEGFFKNQFNDFNFEVYYWSKKWIDRMWKN